MSEPLTWRPAEICLAIVIRAAAQISLGGTEKSSFDKLAVRHKNEKRLKHSDLIWDAVGILMYFGGF